MPTVLNTYGDSRSNKARVCRAVLNHAPLGSSDTSPSRELTDFPDCGVLQDWALAHVLLKCQRYRRWELLLLLRVPATSQYILQLLPVAHRHAALY